MRKFLTALVLIPLGVIFVVFAVANRHLVTVSFDPFGSGDSAFDLPHEADARSARAQLAELRAGAAASRYDQQRLPAPSQGGFYGPGGRDKQGATL